jgi:tetratricopeptide (TPR) repeat protein
MTAQLAIDNMLQLPALAALWLCALALASAPAETKRWPRATILAGAALALVSWIPRTIAASAPARAAALFPAEPGPREDLAYKALSEGKTPVAAANWAAAQSLDPFNAIYPWRRAQIAGAQGHWEQAESLAAHAVELEPDFMNARLLRAEALIHVGLVPEARAALDEFRLVRTRREDIVRHSGYERAVWTFNRRDYDRIAALAGRPPL